MSKITLSQIGNKLDFECKNESNGTLKLSATEALGGNPAHLSPMESLLASILGCSSIDILSILNKQRIFPGKYHITAEGHRVKDAVPGVFVKIDIILSVSSEVNETAIIKAIGLTKDKYCSVLFMLNPDCEISFKHTFI